VQECPVILRSWGLAHALDAQSPRRLHGAGRDGAEHLHPLPSQQ
jgi:hypothetical protein